jgi:hypothetical protein
MMADGYGFFVLQIIIIWHQMIFTYRHLKLDYSVLKPEIQLKVVVLQKKGEIFSF